jgi:hypothetical protein
MGQEIPLNKSHGLVLNALIMKGTEWTHPATQVGHFIANS